MDRSSINRALAKVLAYRACGKEREAEEHFRQLVELLGYEDHLVPQEVVTSRRY